MRNFCEPWTKCLNLTFKKTILTALDPPGELQPNFFLKKHYEPNNGMDIIMLQKKNEGILFSAEIRVVGSYTDCLLTSRMPKLFSPFWQCVQNW